MGRDSIRDILELVRHLGYGQVNIAGHDIGSQVTFSFAANHPEAASRIAMLDVPHPNEYLYSLLIIPRPGQRAFFVVVRVQPGQEASRGTAHRAVQALHRYRDGGAVIMLLAVAITIAAVRIRRADLAEAQDPAGRQAGPATASAATADSRP